MKGFLGCALLLLGAAMAIGLFTGRGVTVTSAASEPTCNPTLSSVTTLARKDQQQHYAPAGAEVVVTGAGLSDPGCSVTSITIGHVTVPRSALAMAPGGSTLTLALPNGASGAARVTDANAEGVRTSSNANLIFIQTPQVSLQAAIPAAGSAVEVDGSGFAPFMTPESGGLSDARVVGRYPSCQGASAQTPVAVLDDFTMTLRAPQAYCQSPLMLLFIAPFDASRPRQCAAAVSSPDYNCMGVPVTVGVVDPYFYIASASPAPRTSVEAGAVITVAGSGFGPSGRAYIDGAHAPVRWTDTVITATVPKGAVTGLLHLRRRSGDLLAIGVGSYHVPDTAPSAFRPSGLADVELAISTPGLPVDQGSNVSLTATLSVNGKPVSGAPVSMAITPAPGSRADVFPASGITDSSGSFSVVLHLRGGPGTDVLIARDGIHDAQARLVVQPTPKASGGILGGRLPFGLSQIRITLSDDPVGVTTAFITLNLVLLALLISLGIMSHAIVASTIGVRVRRAWAHRPGAGTG
jgi:hypothetical protein